MHGGSPIALAILAVALGGPLLLALAGLIFARCLPAAREMAPAWNWRLSLQSALLYIIAFNLTFFIQEVFLVLPKALTPGLDPILYHNNHDWSGDNPLAELFQGTGALAILISGLFFALLLHLGRLQSGDARLFAFWMAFSGLFQSLPQLATVPIADGDDVARAFDYFGAGAGARTLGAIVGLLAIVASGLWLTRLLMTLAREPADIASPGYRTRFAFLLATLPTIAAVPLIIAYRVPRDLMNVIAPPILVTLIGVLWLQVGAWRVSSARPAGSPPSGAIGAPLLIAAALLAFFQLVLRPGIPF